MAGPCELLYCDCGHEIDLLKAEQKKFLTVLAMIESNADFNENDTVTLPLWIMDKVRTAREGTCDGN